jgi:hypothetical protein
MPFQPFNVKPTHSKIWRCGEKLTVEKYKVIYFKRMHTDKGQRHFAFSPPFLWNILSALQQTDSIAI